MRFLIVCLTVTFSCCNADITDFNQDHRTNAQDFMIFSRAWESYAGDLNYNPVCDISNPVDQVIDYNDLIVFMDNWLWEAIQLRIYSDGWGTYRETKYLEDEGTAIFQLTNPGEPYGNAYTYYAYASRWGDFTEMYSFTGVVSGPPPIRRITVTVPVDLDQLNPTEPNMACGVIFLTQYYFRPSVLSNTEVKVTDFLSGEPRGSLFTDANGRYAAQLPAGNYIFDFNEFANNPYYHHHEYVGTNGVNNTYYFLSSIQAAKPNIYVYPEETMILDVSLTFPSGGMVTQSDPNYNQGWHVKVNPSGLIDDQYRFLFYESMQPNKGQHEYGWVVAQQDLDDFFRNNLCQTGFNQQEIEDFIEYWIPLLNQSSYYVIYPQYNETLDKMIRLNFSSTPDNLIRVIYSIHGVPDTIALPEPVIPAFSRTGFTVAEWGVILE